MLRIIPKAAAYVFEEMVLTKMVTADGLTFGDDALRSVQFSEVSALRASRGGMKVGVLYRCRTGADYPSIDGCGVPVGEQRFILMQISTGRKHRRVQKKLVEKIAAPHHCTSVLIVYIVPTSPSSLTLFDGEDPLKSGSKKSGKRVEEITVAAASVLAGVPADVRAKFEPAGHD